jgi:Ca-activated chloride channel homolog
MRHNRSFLLGFFAAIWCVTTAATVGDPAASKSAQALEHYERGEYAEALRLYRDAQLERPDMSELNFNVGGTLFKNGELETALREFEQAASAGSDGLKAAAHYNMGNVFYQEKQYQQAIDAYRQALELDSGDGDAKANMELALRQLEQQQQQQQQQDQQDQQDQDQQQQDQDQQQQDQQGQQDQQQQQEQQQQEQQNNSDEQGQDEKEAAGADQQISQEEAEQLLEALKDREIDAHKRRFRATGKTRGKDW